MKNFLLFLFCAHSLIGDVFSLPDQNIVLETKRISFEAFLDSFNPSIFRVDQGILMTFRYCPDRTNQSWLSQIGCALFDESFNLIAGPQLLSTRARRSKTPSQSEDARIFSYGGKLFVVYNDNTEEIFFDLGPRRDMFIAEIVSSSKGYSLLSPLKLFYESRYSQIQQKNWSPFECNGNLYFTYSIYPHEVIAADSQNGLCYLAHTTQANIHWPYGTLRGSTPPQLVDGEFLAFFHSSTRLKSPVSYGAKLWHYFTGAYTFSFQPPFEIKKISSQPMIGKDFYTHCPGEKRVIFPGGFVISGPHIYLAYGKDDREIWVAKLDKQRLLDSLVNVENVR